MPSTESIPTIVMANAGPLTTTWTAPESSSTASNTILGWEIDNRVQAQWAFDCDSYEKDVARFYACVPLSKEISETLVSWTEAPTPTVGGLFYYSPRIDCPQGWTTAGVAAKNADS